MTIFVLAQLAGNNAARAASAAGESTGLSGYLLSPGFIALALGIIASILTGLKVLNAQRKKVVAIATYHAFNIVEDISSSLRKRNGSTALDKVAEGLKQANEWMKANGWRQLSEGEKSAVKLGFKSMNGTVAVAQKQNP